MDTDTAERFWSQVDKQADHWRWTGNLVKASGTGQFAYYEDGRRRREAAHVVAWRLTRGDLGPGQMVRQTCGAKTCVQHLEVFTQAEFDRWSPENVAARFWARVDRTDPNGCWEWTGRRMSGGRTLPYGQTTYRSRPIGAHVLAWILTHGPIPAGMVVRHTCNNPPCCRTDHLCLGSHAENSADMVAAGRAARRSGLAHHATLFTAEQVREIRARYAAGGISTHELAREYGVAAMVIWRAATGRSYPDVS